MNNNNNNRLNLTAMNNQMNNPANIPMNVPMNNNINNPLNSLNTINNLNNLQAQQLQDLNYVVEEEPKSNLKNIITNSNYILMVMLALAANDVIKFYINKSIKFDNGNHKYFLYNIGALCIVIYLLSRTINKYFN